MYNKNCCQKGGKLPPPRGGKDHTYQCEEYVCVPNVCHVGVGPIVDWYRKVI